MKTTRRVLLLHPFEFPLALCLFVVAAVFTVFPAALEHAPVSFEQRGVIQHLFFHYALMAGSLLTLLGLFVIGERGLNIELGGLTLLLLSMMLNSVAVIASELDRPAEGLNGMTIALRVALLAGLIVRMWIIATRPKVTMTASRDA